MTRRDNVAGFTLIEVLVGLAIGGIVILAGFAALGAVQDGSQDAVESTMDALEGATARATLTDWIAAAGFQSRQVGVAFEGLDADELGLASDELSFPTRARTPLDVPVTGVRLFLDVDPLTAERGLVAEMIGVLGGVPRRMEIAPQATGMAIRYLPATMALAEWTESWVGQEQLPRALELVLEDDESDPLPPLLQLPLRVPLATLQ